MNTYEHLNGLVGSGSIIFNAEGLPGRQSHNLRGILDHAKERGVIRIHIDRIALADTVRRPEAMVTVLYRGGDIGKVYFVDGDHAEQWAQSKSTDSPRRSWFAGCQVSIKQWAAGTWAPYQPKGN